jgi:hypothetical protein
MPLQMFEPSKSPLAMRTLESLLLLRRLRLWGFFFRGSFHREPMGPLAISGGVVGIGQIVVINCWSNFKELRGLESLTSCVSNGEGWKSVGKR